MGRLTAELKAFLDDQRVGVLATIAPGGKPRQSLVYFARDDERLLISTLADRLKARDVRRTGWASLCVIGDEPPYPSATLSGSAEILTNNIGVPTAMIAQRVTGSDVRPEALSDAALAEAGRVVLAIAVDRVGATSYIPSSDQAETTR
ncbi:MAG: TIGR03618 family F420-dependent PPOX class oxidoreductase [Solirubrobacteraceae bacterium]